MGEKVLFRPKPEEVFTPRAPNVHEKMYVDRSELEGRLAELIQGSKHIIIHGESGNGKSWLYKRVLSDKKTPYSVVNLANAVRFGTVDAAIKDKINKSSGSEQRLAEIVHNHNGGAKPFGVGAEYTCQRVFEIVDRDPLEALMGWVRHSGGRRPGLLVFDNFESIVSDEKLVKELANILTLLDDADYAKFNVKICIVGVPSNTREYLTSQSSIQTISNRISELPEVARLTSLQAKTLLSRGFGILGIGDVDDCHLESILWTTDRIAQHVQELGLEVSRAALVNNGSVNDSVLTQARKSWFEESISSVRQIVDANLNARETKAGRRNQVIFAIGCVKTEDFRYSDVEAMVRNEFPGSTAGVELNIIQRLGELENSKHPIIKRVPKGDAYRVINPKVKIAIRVMLRKNGGKVEKIPQFT